MRTFLLAVGLLIGCAAAWLYTYTELAPIHRNWYRPHRWASEVTRVDIAVQRAAYEECLKREITSGSSALFCVALQPVTTPMVVSYQRWDGKQSVREHVDFDICLEHGEFRRMPK